ncbi:protein CIP2A [Pundamilia nyererei]|uniref:Protein CIP2A n=1 Tax=Pundamilia nyererei TaxID=303518 RepID=A0A9Y6STI6_9CICH|nr:PREDICTED: protein CIP2A [Pundamilia nyererei]
MDVTTCLKSLLLAIQQYRDSRTAQHAAQLQKQVEKLSGLKCEQLLSSAQVLPSECVSGLVELAGNPSTSPTLTSSIISLLSQLACDDQSREILHSSYNLTSTLAAVIHCHSNTPGEALVLQCLQVLQKLTYNTRIFQSASCIHELITFLMTNIQSQNEDVVMSCLGLLANLCRDNISVQIYIKSLDNVKQFYRTLINFLAHNSLTVVVFTLSILASLSLNEKVGEKLFDAKNIHQTFQLVFNIIVNGDGTLTRKYSVDLLVDLLKNPKIADYLTRYPHFSACVSQVLGLLHSKDPDPAAKVLELLLAMCSVSVLRSLLCEVVFKPAGPKLRAAGRDGGRKAQCGLALVQCLSSAVEGGESCSLQVLQLLSELLEETLGAESMPDSTLSFVEMLLPTLLGLLKGLNLSQGDAHLRKHCLRISYVTSLLLNILHCVCGFSQVCAEALLKTLELMSKLRQHVKDMETSFYRMLQDQRIVTPLSLALTSHHRDRVQTGLSLLFEATPLPDFPSFLQEQVKDSHVSEIIDVYEQKLGAYASKESRLQDLLEAKALALSQADRLLAQYRFQRAQAEAEEQERRDLEETVDVLRKELNKTEQARKDASIKASSLELQKSQLETKLKQKEDELNKHSAMIAMIHSLSSGKMKSDVNLSL